MMEFKQLINYMNVKYTKSYNDFSMTVRQLFMCSLTSYNLGFWFNISYMYTPEYQVPGKEANINS